ncbi:MAG: DUF1992 domain-containing protein [Chloroflexota bacterium]
MTTDKGIETIIREAMERGEFDDLPGKGKPLDLSAYFDTPEDLRVAYALLKGADVLPAEVEILQEIAAFKEKAASTTDPLEKASVNKQIQALQLKFDTALDRLRQQRSRK